MDQMVSNDSERGFALLREIYRVSVGNTTVGLGPSNLRDCVRRALVPEAEGEQALEWLVDEGLLIQRGAGRTIYISNAGVKEIESSFARPDEGTAHFPAALVRAHAPIPG